MKYLPSQLMSFLHERGARHNITILRRFSLTLFLMIAVYSVLFHVIMEYEGQHHSWVTGVYWTLTVMSTLGFGDITFTSDLGRVFSIIVLMSGVIFFLIMLPFTFIQHFYMPWLESQKKDMVPGSSPPPRTATSSSPAAAPSPSTLPTTSRATACGTSCCAMTRKAAWNCWNRAMKWWPATTTT